jgi:hypothetical protein
MPRCGRVSTPQLVEDLLEIQAAFATERTWCQPSPVVCPDRVRAMQAQGALTPAKQIEYKAALARLRTIADRHWEAGTVEERQLARIAQRVLSQWEGNNRAILEPPPLQQK